MAWIYEAYSNHQGDEPGVVTGKPVGLGGCAEREHATGHGVAMIADRAVSERGSDMEGTTFAIQGFGNVGRNAARLIEERGGRVVAVSSSRGGLYRSDGLPIADLLRAAERKGAAKRVPADEDAGEKITNDELLGLDVDVLVPAAVDGVIHAGNVEDVRASLVLEAANLPVTCDADRTLEERGVAVVPGVLANAGGVVVSYLEWIQNRMRYRWDGDRVNSELESILERAWQDVHRQAESRDVSYRLAAYSIAVERVREAIELRGV